MCESTPRVIKVNDSQYELNIDPTLQATVLRALTGTTPLDTEVDELPIPKSPVWLYATIGLLRWYRQSISPRLGQRCVYEPSCSRYTELALRKHGFTEGIKLSLNRLHRCRPGSGGIDLP